MSLLISRTHRISLYYRPLAHPLQSERYFNALKSLGAPVRLVMLPKESHGYAARESILHMLWEQDQWLDKYVKNKK